MATIASITTPSYSGRSLTLNLSLNSQSIPNNNSVVSWELVSSGTYSGYVYIGSFSVVVNGSTVYSSATRVPIYNGITIASGTITIPHNSDGSKNFSASLSAAIYEYTVNAGNSGSWTLPTIARATTPTLSTYSTKPNTAITINLPRASSSFTHTLTYSCGSDSGTIGTGLNTSATWTIPASFITSSPNASRTCTITCTTYNGSSNIGSSTVTLTVQNYNASAVATITGSTLGSAVTTAISRESSLFTHTLFYSFGSKTNQTLASNVGTSTSFTPPLSLASEIPNTTYGTMTIICKTYYGSTKIGSDTISIFAINIPNSVVPTISNIALAGTNIFKTYYLTNISTVKVTATAAGIYGSTIKSYKITGQGVSYDYNGATFNIPYAGTLTYTVTVTDSRGRTATTTSTGIVALNYNKPIISANIVRGVFNLVNSTFAVDEVLGTTFGITPVYSYSALDGNNSISVKTATCGSLSTTLSGSGAQVYLGKPTVSGGNGSFSTDQYYYVTLTIKDQVGYSTNADVRVETGKVIQDVRKDGRGVAFNRVATVDDAFEVGFDYIWLYGTSYHSKMANFLNGLCVGLQGNAKGTEINTEGSIKMYGTPQIYFYTTETGSSYCRVYTAGTTNPALCFSSEVRISGDLMLSGTFYNSSDKRLKEDIQEIPEEFLDIWKELQPKMFRMKSNNQNLMFGFIAQEVIEVFEKYNLDINDYSFISNSFIDNEDQIEYFSLSYQQFEMINFWVAQKQQEIIEKQEKELKELKERIDKIEILLTK